MIFFQGALKQTPSAEIWKDYQNKCQDFKKEVEVFSRMLSVYSPQDIKSLKTQWAKVRFSYKEIEGIMSYMHPQDANDYLNGAPLVKIERNAPRLVLIDPKGLQTLEEVVYADELDVKAAKELSHMLSVKLGEIIDYQSGLVFYDHQVFESMRFEVIRIVSLGITGFDTPGSSLAIEESAKSWSILSQQMKSYTSMLPKSLKEEYTEIFKGGEDYLANNPSFEAFDRAHFIRNFANPAYGYILRVQKELGIEMPGEVYESPLSINYQSADIFSNEFFDDRAFLAMHSSGKKGDQIALGKRLFYEVRLSKNLDKSCATCHNPEKGFSDGHSTSKGTNGPLLRNSPTLLNAGLARSFFYDLRADNIDQQAEHVIFNEEEFGNNYHSIFSRLSSDSSYVADFQLAFPDFKGEINRNTLSLAMSQYVLSLKTFDSPVDLYLTKKIDSLPQEVYAGFNLFMGKATCGTCHFAPTFSGLVPPFFEENESEVLGVLKNPKTIELDDDLGRSASKRLTYETEVYDRSFKTVTVRNISKTAPYFHHGQYNTLEEVVEFYNVGGGIGFGLEVPNQTLPPDSLNLSEVEKRQLIAFLKAI